ncbi:MAG: hypothetical protein R3F34_07745 [Planctomycetota bacterium]
MTPPVGTCGVASAHVTVCAFSAGPPTSSPWVDGGCAGGPSTLLLDLFGYLALGGQGLQYAVNVSGSPVVFSFPIPASRDFCGSRFTAQAAFLNGFTDFAFRWGDAVDNVIGN